MKINKSMLDVDKAVSAEKYSDKETLNKFDRWEFPR